MNGKICLTNIFSSLSSPPPSQIYFGVHRKMNTRSKRALFKRNFSLKRKRRKKIHFTFEYQNNNMYIVRIAALSKLSIGWLMIQECLKFVNVFYSTIYLHYI